MLLCVSFVCSCVWLSPCVLACLFVMIDSGCVQIISHKVASKRQVRDARQRVNPTHSFWCTFPLLMSSILFHKNFAVLIKSVCVSLKDREKGKGRKHYIGDLAHSLCFVAVTIWSNDSHYYRDKCTKTDYMEREINVRIYILALNHFDMP